MTISLDGFITDQDGSVEALYPDLAALRAITNIAKNCNHSAYINREAAKTASIFGSRFAF
jgi:hypothetical protein